MTDEELPEWLRLLHVASLAIQVFVLLMVLYFYAWFIKPMCQLYRWLRRQD